MDRVNLKVLLWPVFDRSGQKPNTEALVSFTEPNNTKPNLMVYKFSNPEIKNQFLCLLSPSNLISLWRILSIFLLNKKTSILL